MTAAATHCKNGHPWTEKNTKIRFNPKYPNAIYRQCRGCIREQEADRKRDDGSRWASGQRALRTATIEREPMAECWSCVPSPHTGIRGDVRPDSDDGKPKCFACGRVQRATVVLA